MHYLIQLLNSSYHPDVRLGQMMITLSKDVLYVYLPLLKVTSSDFVMPAL